ncbi:MAG: hypothetical protein QE487_16530 [Fluviicola sp.]|nr:hypothetical protein [Fluviicola sp.]
MNTHAAKTFENVAPNHTQKGQSIENSISRTQKGNYLPYSFTDNRSETVAQRKLQEIANTSRQVSQLRVFQDVADNGAKVNQVVQMQKIADTHSIRQQPPIQRKGNDISSEVVQRVVSVSGLQYIPAAADLLLINALDGQIATAETAASNDVQNNPAPLLHTNQQAAYMNNPTAAGWGNCVEEKLNVWAGANGWSMQNNGGGSNPDYSRTRNGTKIWADLTTAAEAGAGASHIIDKLTRKVRSGSNDATWVAADVVHQGLNPLAGGPAAVVATNGVVSLAHRNSWQQVKTYQGKGDVGYDDLMERRINAADNLPSYAIYTQVWNAARRSRFTSWIDGSKDADLDEEEDID